MSKELVFRFFFGMLVGLIVGQTLGVSPISLGLAILLSIIGSNLIWPSKPS